ncbi:MAG TPA: alpha-glucan family phosphorylase, partial [bacterium]|nr:alpha-glucan family phosphorylase [bacterium]
YWQKPVLRTAIEEHGGLDKVSQIPDEKIWALHTEFKAKLILKVRERFAHQLLRENADPQVIYEKTQNRLVPEAFMIGFARRFAEYKRVSMLLEDEERLFQFMEHAYRVYGAPVNIIYAGKPHPNNYSGREKITEILNIAERLNKRAAEKKFQAQIIFVQGYDIDLARYLEAGVDIWLNNPIRPLEASGTSGMKAGMNGVLNVSISDGWVPEGVVQGKNGWLFGVGDANSTAQDRAELFTLLETTILPLYFKREKESDVFSREWVGLMKNSIESITKKFNTDRMLSEYVEKMYLPAVKAALVPAK